MRKPVAISAQDQSLIKCVCDQLEVLKPFHSQLIEIQEPEGQQGCELGPF